MQSQFIILLLCIVIQTNDEGLTANAENNVGTAQIAVVISIVPVTLVALAQGVMDMKSDIKDDLANEDGGLFRSKADNKVDKAAFTNPMGEGLMVASADGEDDVAED